MKVQVLLRGEIDLDVERIERFLEVENGTVVIVGADEGEQMANGEALHTAIQQSLPAFDGHPFLEVAEWSTICRKCGCTDQQACPGGCAWAEVDLCTSCVIDVSEVAI